eukprot:8900161-Pyramimonas_sp.AAC.1
MASTTPTLHHPHHSPDIGCGATACPSARHGETPPATEQTPHGELSYEEAAALGLAALLGFGSFLGLEVACLPLFFWTSFVLMVVEMRASSFSTISCARGERTQDRDVGTRRWEMHEQRQYTP